MIKKQITAQAAAELINCGDTVTIAGFVGVGVPDEILLALENRFKEHSKPTDLTLLFAAAPGDGKDRGLNRLAHAGMLRRTIGGHYGLAPKLGKLATSGEIQAYNFPQGVISHMYRDIAAGKPGTLTRVGIDTFVDPRIEGGKINKQTIEDLVEVVTISGEEMLFYKTHKVDVAIIRGTSADADGNISMEREALRIDNLSQAMAAKNSGGVVIAQVERIVPAKTLSPRMVEVPSAMIDAIVLAKPENHVQTYGTVYSPYLDGQDRAPSKKTKITPLDARKVIARRTALELPFDGGVVNLGIGVPEGVAMVASEQNWLEAVTLTAEPGVIGGQPSSGLDFGTAVNTDVIITQSQQFDFYDGGGLALAVLGMAEISIMGDVNVSRFGSRLPGAGGFINISQSAQKVIFCGTFTAGGLKTSIEDGKLVILKEGSSTKFIRAVQQVTFSGQRAVSQSTPILYVTERCVFELRPEGLALIEIAPGIDLENDILAQMDFRPVIGDVKQMDRRIFQSELM